MGREDGKLIPAGFSIEPMARDSMTYDCRVEFDLGQDTGLDNLVEFEQDGKGGLVKPANCRPRESHVPIHGSKKKHHCKLSDSDAPKCIAFTGMEIEANNPHSFWVTVTVNNIKLRAKASRITEPDFDALAISSATATIQKVLADTLTNFIEIASKPVTPGEKRFFPHGVGLISVNAEVAWSATGHIKVEVKVADVEAKVSDAGKPNGQEETEGS